MKINDNTKIFIGPPGTGKTRKLIDIATYLIRDGCDPRQIGYISFTKQAVKEARDRIIASTSVDEENFIGFRTLHSMAFWLMGKRIGEIITEKELYEVAQTVIFKAQEKERLHMYFKMYSYARMTGTPLSKTWETQRSHYSGTEEDFLQWVKDYKCYKKSYGKIDFNDLIIEYNVKGQKFPFVYLFVDEAQDFTIDQWQMVRMIAATSQWVYVAGDSDQNIFGWAGADSEIFDELEGEREILGQSYRLPRKAHSVAKRILGILGRKINYKPTSDEGELYWLTPEQFKRLPFNNGETWFVLAACNHDTHAVAKDLIKLGVAFQRLDKRRYSADIQRRFIKWYETLLEDGVIWDSSRKKLAEVVPQLDKCLEDKVPWQKAFSGWAIEDIRYHDKVTGHPINTHVGTFHSCKGAEADNVVLLGECTNKIKNLLLNDDKETWKSVYVAATRTKKRLFCVQSTTKEEIPWHRILNPLISKLSHGPISA